MLQPKRAPIFAATLLALAAGFVANDAQAQIFLGTGPTPAVAMPEVESAAPQVAAEAAKVAQSSLRFMPSTLDGLRLTGEAGDLRWPVYLTASQVAMPMHFRVGYDSAVSVLPDSSTLEVFFNGRKIGTEVVDAPQGLRTAEFAVPPDLVHKGYNAISLSLQQRHRVDCSVVATYELWTRINPEETGLVLEGPANDVSDVSDIPALLPNYDGTMPIHIMLAGKTNPAHVRRLIRATQAIAIAGRFQQPLVDIAASSSDTHGINLALGTRAALVNIPQLAGMIGTTGPLLEVLPAREGGRPTLVVTGSDDGEVDQALATLEAERRALGSPEGQAAIMNYPAFKTNGDEALRLRDLGAHSEEFSGRFFRKSVNLMLPADFLASDYGRGTFDLAGGYAAGLRRDAQVRVDVNGRSSGVIKLPSLNGDAFRHNQLFLPLGLMRPGLNRIDIFAETPRPEDATCAAADGRRFLFLDSSVLRLPVLARVQRLPDLARTTSGGLPFTSGTPHLVVPKPDRETMGAALSLTARAAVAAGHPIAFAFSTTTPSDEDGSTLVVSPARFLDPGVMTAIGLDPARVETAWRDAGPAQTEDPQAHWWLTNTDGPPACRTPPRGRATPRLATLRPVPVKAPEAPAASSSDNDDLFERWAERDRQTVSWSDRINAAAAAAESWVGEVSQVFQARVASEVSRDEIAPGASLILAQGFRSNSREHLTMIVTAPDSTTLRSSVACLFDPQVWSKVHGRLAVLDASDGAVTSTDATSFRYTTNGHGSLANTRLVLAGWFSLNPVAYVGVALLMALCLGGSTLWFVAGVGRRQE